MKKSLLFFVTVVFMMTTSAKAFWTKSRVFWNGWEYERILGFPAGSELQYKLTVYQKVEDQLYAIACLRVYTDEGEHKVLRVSGDIKPKKNKCKQISGVLNFEGTINKVYIEGSGETVYRKGTEVNSVSGNVLIAWP